MARKGLEPDGPAVDDARVDRAAMDAGGHQRLELREERGLCPKTRTTYLFVSATPNTADMLIFVRARTIPRLPHGAGRAP